MRSDTPIDSAATQGGDDKVRARQWTVRRIALVVVLMLISELIPVATLLYSTVIPFIAKTFVTDQASWSVTIGYLSAAVSMPLVGKLADMYGKKKLLLAVLLTFVAGSVIAAVAGSFAIFLVGRALQGAVFAVAYLCYSLVRDLLPRRIVPLAVSITVTGTGIVVILQPLLSGWLIDSYGYVGVGWFLAATAAVFTVAALLVAGESQVRIRRSRPDFLGAALLGASVGCALVAVSLGSTWGWSSARFLGLLLGAAVLMAVWVVQAGRAKQPLVNLSQLKDRKFGLTVVATGLIYAPATATSAIAPTMAMTPRAVGGDYGFGMTASAFAVFGVLQGCGILLGGVVVGVIAGRVGTRICLIVSALLIVAGILAIGLERASLTGTLVAFTVVGLGIGAVNAAIPNLVIESVPAERQSVSASLPEVSRTLLAATSVALVYVILNAHLISGSSSPAYSGAGIMSSLVFLAVLVAAGMVAGIFIPRRQNAR